MPKYRVWGTVTVSVYTEVEAENTDDALDVASVEWGGINGYVGNGGIDKLIGVTGSDESIDADGEVEWKEAEEINE